MIEKPASVRTADYRDEGCVFGLLTEMHRHNSNGWGWPYRPELVLARIETATRHDAATRTNPNDKRIGVIGVIGPPGGPLVGTVGIFMESATWFTDFLVPTELFLFVRKGERGAANHERELMAYAEWFHAGMRLGLDKPGYPPMRLLTGFLHAGERFGAMDRLWRRLSRGRKVGSLYWKD